MVLVMIAGGGEDVADCNGARWVERWIDGGGWC